MTQLLLPSFFLSMIGIFDIFGIKQSLAINQIFYVIIGFLAFFVSKKIGRNFFATNSQLLYWFFIFLLAATFIIGLEVKGSKRWIDLYFFNFQTSEIFKPFFILFLADFLIRDYKIVNPINIFLFSLLYFLLPTLIIFKQPDLGNAAVYFFIFIVVVLFSDLAKKYILYFCLFLFLALPIGWKFMQGYQKDRIASFLNPKIDQQGIAYNITQAIITVGSGKFAGRGLGLGTQSRLYFLPENHTDFAFSSMIEQFGFLGGFTVIVLYLIIGTMIVKRLPASYLLRDRTDKKNFLYLVGFLSYFIFQILVNVGMNLGLFPITGIALPFISFGGSSFVAIMIGMALIP
ncbi:rod shape-determining protein RodA [Candidatus Roizmanbacteria bacterium]|nr:rod shape-determining protein RodA [Candidatus Roizmanbacteria bacterium]